jgi:hypothetical protein
MLTLPKPPDQPPVIDVPTLPGVAVDEPACGCPTHTTPGTRLDRITTVHARTCPLYRAGDSVTRRYAPGTLDAVLDERFGPAVAPDLLAPVLDERFRAPARPCEGGMWCRCPQSSPCPTRQVTR